MLALILGFIYQHSCRKYLAAVRTYQRLCVPKTLNPTVMVMKSAQDGT